MKIVHLTDTYAPVIGGIERQVEQLARMQVAAGHDVTVVSGRHEPGPSVTREGGVLVRRPRKREGYAHTLPLHLDDMDADVYHAHLSVVSPKAVRAAGLVHDTGLPVAVTVHSMWPARSAVATTLLRVAGLDDPRVAWSAVSTVAAERVRAAVSSAVRVDVVPNAVDTRWWRNPHAPDAVRPGVHAVLVARLARRKRVLPVLRAWSRMPAAGVRFTVVGDGPQRAALTTLVRRAGLHDRVDLVGVRDPRGVRRLLHEQADLFVACSALESFGIAALEARAAGVPVIARRGTGVADFVQDGVDGLFADTDQGIAAAINALATSPGELARLTRNARRSPPAVDRVDAVAAVDRLYARARGDRVAPAVTRVVTARPGALTAR